MADQWNAWAAQFGHLSGQAVPGVHPIPALPSLNPALGLLLNLAPQQAHVLLHNYQQIMAMQAAQAQDSRDHLNYQGASTSQGFPLAASPVVRSEEWRPEDARPNAAVPPIRIGSTCKGWQGEGEEESAPGPSAPSVCAKACCRADQRPDSPFVMGELDAVDYYASHFMRGTQLQLANGKLKRVEDMSTDDFLLSAGRCKELVVDASTVENITVREDGLVNIVFSVGRDRDEVEVDCQLEHPYFVIGMGWASCHPKQTADTYGLECRQLKIGDVCVSLTRRGAAPPADDPLAACVSLAEARQHVMPSVDKRQAMGFKKRRHASGRRSAPLPEKRRRVERSTSVSL